MKRYRCIEGFGIPEVNDGGVETGNYYFVEAGSVWNLNNRKNYLGTECHLEQEEVSEGFLAWIEISDETLERYFEVG